MAKYILLVNWTDQGIRNIKDWSSVLTLAGHWRRSMAASLKISS